MATPARQRPAWHRLPGSLRKCRRPPFRPHSPLQKSPQATERAKRLPRVPRSRPGCTPCQRRNASPHPVASPPRCTNHLPSHRLHPGRGKVARGDTSSPSEDPGKPATLTARPPPAGGQHPAENAEAQRMREPRAEGAGTLEGLRKAIQHSPRTVTGHRADSAQAGRWDVGAGVPTAMHDSPLQHDPSGSEPNGQSSRSWLGATRDPELGRGLCTQPALTALRTGL